MAGSKSDVYEVDVLKATTGQATTILNTTALANVYVALYTVAPSDSAAGTEVTGGSYARVDSKGKWAVPAAGSVSNNAVITFPTATADWAAGGTQIVAFALMTALSGGSMLMWGTLTTAKNVLSGDTPSFAVGQLTLTED
jgi:hypothetical protein